MTRIELTSRVGPDGVLTLKLPLGPEEANSEVVVTVRTANGKGLALPKDQKAWEEFVRTTAGSIDDPTFRRHEQGEYEQRDPLP
jgi:hypothetical protein